MYISASNLGSHIIKIAEVRLFIAAAAANQASIRIKNNTGPISALHNNQTR